MKKKIWIWLGGLLVALMIVGAVGTVTAYAQDNTTLASFGRGPGGRGGHGFLNSAELEAAAKVLGMTTDELSAAMQAGKTLQELADSAGVDIQTVQDAIQKVRESDFRERIQQAAKDGTMTQEKADWLLEGLDKGFLDRPGIGFGFGSHHGHGAGTGPRQFPPAQQGNP